jgi:hypothetical protein
MFDVFDIGGLAMSPICKFFRHFIWICQYFFIDYIMEAVLVRIHLMLPFFLTNTDISFFRSYSTPLQYFDCKYSHYLPRRKLQKCIQSLFRYFAKEECSTVVFTLP